MGSKMLLDQVRSDLNEIMTKVEVLCKTFGVLNVEVISVSDIIKINQLSRLTLDLAKQCWEKCGKSSALAQKNPSTETTLSVAQSADVTPVTPLPEIPSQSQPCLLVPSNDGANKPMIVLNNSAIQISRVPKNSNLPKESPPPTPVRECPSMESRNLSGTKVILPPTLTKKSDQDVISEYFSSPAGQDLLQGGLFASDKTSTPQVSNSAEENTVTPPSETASIPAVENLSALIQDMKNDVSDNDELVNQSRDDSMTSSVDDLEEDGKESLVSAENGLVNLVSCQEDGRSDSISTKSKIISDQDNDWVDINEIELETEAHVRYWSTETDRYRKILPKPKSSETDHLPEAKNDETSEIEFSSEKSTTQKGETSSAEFSGDNGSNLIDLQMSPLLEDSKNIEESTVDISDADPIAVKDDIRNDTSDSNVDMAFEESISERAPNVNTSPSLNVEDIESSETSLIDDNDISLKRGVKRKDLDLIIEAMDPNDPDFSILALTDENFDNFELEEEAAERVTNGIGTCKFCKKTFKGGLQNLLIHERIHTGVKPFKCMICEQAFVQKSHVRSHVKICFAKKLKVDEGVTEEGKEDDEMMSDGSEDDDEIPEDFISEDEANSEDFWSEGAKAEYQINPMGTNTQWESVIFEGKEAKPDRSQKLFATKRRRLRNLLDWICEQINSESFPPDFHPLKNQDPSFYGLAAHPRTSNLASSQKIFIGSFIKGSWVQDLMLLLLKHPFFPTDPDESKVRHIFDNLFRSSLHALKITVHEQVWVNIFNGFRSLLQGKLRAKFFEQKNKRPTDTYRGYRSTAICRELLTFGIKPFLSNPGMDEEGAEDYVSEDKANSDDLWSEEARSLYGIKHQVDGQLASNTSIGQLPPGGRMKIVDPQKWEEFIYAGKEAQPDRTDKMFATKRRRLRNLLDWICQLSSGPLVGDFHPLQNKCPSYYGLSTEGVVQQNNISIKGSWKQELMLLLINHPAFSSGYHEAKQKISKIFSIQVNYNGPFSVYSRMCEGQLINRAPKVFVTTKITRELFAFGIRPFLSETEASKFTDDLKSRQPSSISKKPPLIENDFSQKCVDFLSENKNNTLSLFVAPAYTLYELKSRWSRVLANIKKNMGFAVVGLQCNPENIKASDHPTVKGMVMLEVHKSSTFNPQKSMDFFVEFMLKYLGVSKNDIFNRKEISAKCRVLNTSMIDKFTRLGAKEQKSKVQEFRETFEKLNETHGSLRIENVAVGLEYDYFEDGRMPIKLDLNEDMDLKDINSIAILMGGDPKNLTLKEVITQEYLSSCQNQSVLHNASSQNASKDVPTKYFNNKMIGHLFLDIFTYFAGFKKSSEMYPFFKELCDEVFDANQQMRLVKLAEESKFGEIQRLCPTCGLKENEMPHQYQNHISACKLDQTPCDCDVTFKTPRDKERHLKLHHSDRKYLECPHCPELIALSVVYKNTSKVKSGPEALANHIKMMHGTGEPVRCEVCDQPYKSENNLHVHRLNHELHFCQICSVEILGRMAFKKHMMKKHESGFTCDIRSCKKVFFDQKWLDIHKKREHSNSWKNVTTIMKK